MPDKLFSLLSNTLLFILLIGILTLPIGSVTYTKLDTKKSVLSEQDKRPAVQFPQQKILKRNGAKLDQESPDNDQNSDSNRDYDYLEIIKDVIKEIGKQLSEDR